MPSSSGSFHWFRKIALAEGVSFLVLLLIAMPLKYMANWPLGVTVVGGIHGLLFVAFLVLAWEVKREHRMSWGWLAKALIASIFPFGTFIMDKQWIKEEAAIK